MKRQNLDDVTKNTACVIYREESKDRPECRDIPGILYRQRKRFVKAAHNDSLSTIAFSVLLFFFLLIFG